MNETIGVVRERERESNTLKNGTLICDVKSKKSFIINKDRYA